jgi:hypothetical protein
MLGIRVFGIIDRMNFINEPIGFISSNPSFIIKDSI